ncbi:biotin/methionine sulfoxide reductase [Kineococcus radiotolerans]|uniref:Biotin/methionine sulfoxide reductase n=1 Tax=Kineococcus radiotolerans TaxID=131568 RepID=A0A7W4TPG6_KINRA|nr:molybdopterin-dependent oxidoreductase [Kineococcus radiotolerans]MBB2902691.1 biotin/methionine sulfoxide reductase [Kineococcus radiotolerans]
MSTTGIPHSSHWGAFRADPTADGVRVRAHPDDPAPSALLRNVAVAATPTARVLRPHVRRGWWEDGPGPDERRGRDEFLPVEWDELLDRVAGEYARVLGEHGPRAVYAGSYGWASAGRFHHSQSQLHRFSHCLGGAVRSTWTYSHNVGEVLMPRVVGSQEPLISPTAWTSVEAATDLVIALGGLPAKNSEVASGGITRHEVAGRLRSARARGAEFVLVSPLRDDLAAELDADWFAVVPGSDAALLLAMCHVLLTDGSFDAGFLERFTAGSEQFLASLRGADDGVEKTPEWAEPLTGIAAARIRDLARRAVRGRTMITVSWSVARTRFGEQPLWAAVALAAMIGQIGLPGGGFGHGYASTGGVGKRAGTYPLPTFPQFADPLRIRIPVARIADALLHPGEPYEVDGRHETYPHLRLVHWAGGNPFHHHQDLQRLQRAFRAAETIVVHEPFWTSTARHADVVFAATTTLEREDVGAARYDDRLIAMGRVHEPLGEARDDYEVLSGLAHRLGTGERFTEGRTAGEWVEHLYEEWRTGPAARAGITAPPHAKFLAAGEFRLPPEPREKVMFASFRADPDRFPLRTPSGRIELHSETVAGFGYDDCPGHPVWLAPEEQPDEEFPLRLVANNPATRLHSQLDHGATSQAGKVAGREPVRMHARDAAARGLADGQVVVLRSRRGSCLGGLVVSDAVREGVVQMSTGSWFDPVAGAAAGVTCGYGNVNVLTRDVGSSRLSQACTGQHATVQVSAFEGVPPRVTIFDQPA